MAGQSWQEEQEAAAYIVCSQEARGMLVLSPLLGFYSVWDSSCLKGGSSMLN